MEKPALFNECRFFFALFSVQKSLGQKKIGALGTNWKKIAWKGADGFRNYQHQFVMLRFVTKYWMLFLPMSPSEH